MSRNKSSAVFKNEEQAHIFAALGDPNRLSLVAKLIDRKPHSISALTAGTKITRQAITKHLTVLEGVGLVTNIKEGRERLYLLDPKPLESLQEYLDVIAAQWDEALNNLKTFVEE
ncbi:MAG: metalloregulator ArsR/SmtB family transcription factor [Bdellovibrionota bacterium]